MINNKKTVYNPKVFDVNDIQEAKNIILTPESGMQTDQRWELETKYLSEDISKYFNNLDHNSTIIDYGCGIGRLSKELIKKFNCKIIGVDISESMRKLAIEYVQNDNFKTVSPAQLNSLVLDGLRVDAAISIWVLQHCIDPIIDVALLKAAMKEDALLYVLNNKISAVPTNNGWINNGINIYALLTNKFTQIKLENLPKDVAKDKLHTETFILKGKNNKKNIIPNELQIELNKGIQFYKQKEYHKAIEIYNKLLKKYLTYSDIYNALAVNLKSIGDIEKSIKMYIRAIQIDPLNGYIYNNLGNAFKTIGKYNEALRVYAKGLKIHPNDANTYNNLAMVYEKLNDLEKAILAYKKAISIDPKFSKAINNLAVVLYKQKKYEQSVDLFKLALKVDPEYYEVYSNLGAALNKANRYDEAIEVLQKAIKHNPKHGGAYTNLGNVYNKIYEYKKAVKMHQKSIELEPNGSNAYSNIGTSYKNLGQMSKAIESYKKAIELEPNFVNAHFDLATVYLALKDFKNGWEEYEWRFKKDEMKGHILKYKDIFSKPRFDGTQNIEGKKLLIHTEQGFGDSIMFAKFVDIIKDKYKCQVILQCRDELRSLFENSFKNIDQFYSRDSQATPEFDYQYSMLSLPYLLNMTTTKDIPNTNPYLAPFEVDELKIKKDKKKIDVGICWSASVTGESYDGKVFDIEYLRPLIENDKFNVYTLQVGVENEDIKKANLQDKVIDLTSKLTDFNKTAYLMSQLDFVISSDTSVAHLAGAINKEVIVPLQKVPDWRWENKGEKSYWYSSAKLFRQKTARVWNSVFQSIYAKMNKQYKVRLKLK